MNRDRRATGDRTLKLLAPRTWIYRGFFSNSAVLEFERECVLVDCQVSPRAGEHLRRAIAARIGKPVTKILLTHHHGDHCGGIAAFSEAEVIASRETEKLLIERDFHRKRYADTFGLVIQEEHPALRPGQVFEGRQRIEIDDETIEFFFTGKAETEDAHVIWCPKRKVVATGDGVPSIDYPFMGTPFLDEGLRDDGEWLRYLRAIRDLGAEILIPGHGPAIVGEKRIRARIDLLISLFTDLLETTREGLERGMSPEQIQKHVERKIGHYRSHPELREKTLCQRFAVYRCINSLTPGRAGSGWWDDLRPSLLPELSPEDRDRHDLVLSHAHALLEFLLNPIAPVPRRRAIAFLRAAPVLRRSAPLLGLHAELLFKEGMRTHPTVDGSEFFREAYQAALEGLRLDAREHRSLIIAGAIETLGAIVLVQGTSLPRRHLLSALESPALGFWQRKMTYFWLGKLAQLDERDPESDAYYRKALGWLLRPCYPVLRNPLRGTP